MRSGPHIAWQVRAAILSGGIAILAGCGNDRTALTAERPMNLTRSSARPATVFELMEPPSGDRLVGILTETEVNVAACMSSLGWKYQVTDLSYLAAQYSAESNSKATAGKHGYGLADAALSPPEQPSDPNADYVASRSPDESTRYLKDLYDSPSGCLATVERAQFDAYGVSIEAYDAWDLLKSKAFADPRLVRAWKDWSSCMQRRGFDYNNSEDARGSLRSDLSRIVPTGTISLDSGILTAFRDEEIRVAVADSNCYSLHVEAEFEAAAQTLATDFAQAYPDIAALAGR